MIVAMWIIAIFVVGFMAGGELTYIINRAEQRRLRRNRAALREHETNPAPTLYDTMTDALDQIEASLKELNPPHPKNCACAYCEIKYGTVIKAKGTQASVYDKDTGEVWHPEYIRQLQNKINTLQNRNKQLRADYEWARSQLGFPPLAGDNTYSRPIDPPKIDPGALRPTMPTTPYMTENLIEN